MVPHMMAMAIAVLTVPVMPARDGVGSAKDPLATYRRAYRVVVALAPSRRDPDLAVQRRIFAALGAAAAERDLVLATYDDATPEGRRCAGVSAGQGSGPFWWARTARRKSRPIGRSTGARCSPPSTPCRCVVRRCVGRRESEHQAA